MHNYPQVIHKLLKPSLIGIFIAIAFAACSSKDIPTDAMPIESNNRLSESETPLESSLASNPQQSEESLEEELSLRRYPPAPDLPPAPDAVRIAVISDINSSYGTIGYSPIVKAAVNDILRRQTHIVVSPGDLVAGQKAGLPYAQMWRAFHYEIGDVFFDNNIEFIMAPGNHDASGYPQHEAERRAYRDAFQDRLPRAELLKGSHFPFYYGVLTHDILIIALDITRPLRDDDPQLTWLEEALENARHARATLVLGHLPLAPINMRQFFDTAGSERLLSILQKTPRAIYISGHHHIFYPGHIGELRTIASPALGSGPRSLFGSMPVNGYVQITLHPDSPPTVTALVAPNFKRMIDLQKLPKQILQTQREDIGMAEYILENLDRSVRPSTL